MTKNCSRRSSIESLETRQVMDSGAITLTGNTFFYTPVPELYLPFHQPHGFVVRTDEPSPVGLFVGATHYRSFTSFNLIPILEIEIVSAPQNGTASISEDGMSILYQPNPGFAGRDTLSYRTVNKIRADKDLFQDDTQSSEITIEVVQQPWLAVPDWARVEVDGTVRVNLLKNDVPNAQFEGVHEWKLRLVEASSASGGRIALAEDGTSIVYQAASGFVGVDEVSYLAKDQDGFTTRGVAKIRVTDKSASAELWPEYIDQLAIEEAVERYGFSFGSFIHHNFHHPILYSHFALTADSGGANSSSLESRNSYTGTNNQYGNIDEGDWVKTDGNHLYVLSNDRGDWNQGGFRVGNSPRTVLSILDVRDPLKPQLIKQLIFQESHANALDLHGGRLTVFLGTEANKTQARVFDVNKPSEPRLVSTSEFSGRFLQSRRTDGRVVLTTQSYPDFPHVQLLDWADSTKARTETGVEYLARVQDRLSDLLLPSFVVSNASGQQVVRGDLTEYAQPRLELLNQWEQLNLITLDTSSDSGKPVDWDLALAGSQLLVTDGAIYTASHGGLNYNQTVVEKFDFGPNGIQWTASGIIDGSLLNSFSMDDHNGQLRIATTNASFIRRESPSPIGITVLDLPPSGSSSNLYVLDEAAGDQLSVIGSITGLAPGEQIYAARFVQDRAYLVTFERVDPLFVINLADPTKPTVEGELKIPGFSQYMEMIGDDHILSVGRDADPATGMFGGIVVSLFDVRDASSPKLKSRVEVEGSRNVNLPMAFSNGGISDHHAVRYLASHETLALPIWGYFENGGGLGQFYKMLTFKVDVDKGIVESGAIKFDSMVTRAVRLGDFLYSMSGRELKVSNLASPGTTVAHIRFDADEPIIVRETEWDEVEIAELIKLRSAVAGSTVEIESPSSGTIVRAEWTNGYGKVNLVDQGKRLEVTPDRKSRGQQTIRVVVEKEGVRREESIPVLAESWSWNNKENKLDSNADGNITSVDALLTINLLNSGYAGKNLAELDRLYEQGIIDQVNYLDCNNDGYISALDALMVINHLNQERIAAAEAAVMLEGEREKRRKRV